MYVHPNRTRSLCLLRDKVPAGHAIIEFIEPFKGEALIKESELILKDRGIVVGDVVKRLPSDPASGSVIKTSIQCTIEPIYTDSLYHGTDPWPHKPEENTMCLPAEELQYTEIEHGAFVFYRNWFGEVTNKFEEVTIRLENGSVVRVLNPYELQVPNYMKYARSDNKGSLASILNRARTRLEADGTSPPLQDLVEDFFPGQIVHTKKSNLRLGSWVIGSYSPQVPPRGVIVEARVVSIQVDWMTNNFNGGPLHQAMPDEILGIHELQEVKVFSGYGIEPAISGTLYGSRYASNAGVGDKVRFRDISGACTKYSGDSPIHRTHGVFRRIPRMITQGFDMNVFTVKDTKTTVVVQWQDGSVTEQDSKSLVPYMNVDENDVWIGELVSIKSAEVKESGVLRLTEVGVVQAVDARERLARVRWYQAPKVMFLPDEPSTLLPETYLGELSSRETSVSLYEVNAYPPLARRRGDMVLIKPNELHKVSILHQDPAQSIAQSTTKNMAHLSCDVEVPSMPGAYDEDTHPMQDDRDQTLDQPEDSSTNTIPSKASVQDLRWLGEIVDLGLDGLLTIRLGAVEPIEDVKVPVDQVVLVVGGDDEDFSSEDEDEDEDEDEYDDSSEYGSQYDPDESPGLILMNRGRNSNHVIEETVVYEGGERLDSAPEDAWMTSDEEPLGDDSKADDGQGDEDHEMPDVQKDDRITRINEESPERTELPHTSAFNDAMIAHSRSSSESRLKLESYNEYNFSRFPDMPQQFEILDETPPTDHHFLSKTSSGLSASLLRRISKEHGIIKDSLPAGIWARTWAERLDLVRVLIIGPQGTPYKLAPFVFDFYFPPSFPSVPPEAHFHSWTSGARINPNLYEDG